MTDQEKLAELRNRINEAAEQSTLMPVQRQNNVLRMSSEMMVALPVPIWDAILEELDRE